MRLSFCEFDNAFSVISIDSMLFLTKNDCSPLSLFHLVCSTISVVIWQVYFTDQVDENLVSCVYFSYC
jgi:hypothetical protein